MAISLGLALRLAEAEDISTAIDLEQLQTSLSTLGWYDAAAQFQREEIMTRSPKWLLLHGHQPETPSLPTSAEWAICKLLFAGLQGQNIGHSLLDVISFMAEGKFWLPTRLRALLEAVESTAAKSQTPPDSLFVYRAMSYLLVVFKAGSYVTRLRNLYTALPSTSPVNSGYFAAAGIVIERLLAKSPESSFNEVYAPDIYL